MFIRLLILFTCIPLLELYVLLEAGRQIGLFWTVLLILATGVSGAWLARTQGLEIVRRIQLQMSQGEMPGAVLLDGVMVLVGGLLLLTPGFCTDLIGFTCLVPLTRSFWRNLLTTWVRRNVEQGNIRINRM
ncbi:MAG TPA: FxsA family protein [Desulfuromonadales bacterium]|nr:FxsA family protein [Desulfuromonadales bacterium]